MASLPAVVGIRIEEIKTCVIAQSQSLSGWEVRHARHLAPGKYEYLDNWKPLNVGDVWARQGQTAFIRREITVPCDWKGLRTALVMTTGGEGLLSINGRPYHGVDDNRGYILLSKECKGGEHFSCEIEIKTGNYFEYVVKNPEQTYVLSESKLIGIDPDIEAAYYDFSVVHEAATGEKNATLQEAILLAIKKALATVDFRDAHAPAFKPQLAEARRIMREELGRINFGDTPAKNFFAGHSHIDVAWLWPLKETARKVGRTYSTVTTLMDEYPDYHFVCSQVPLFIYLKENFPSIYEKVKARVEEGRFEPIGGTWVENDCNLVSGESLVRQCLYGKRFFKNEFGVDVKVGWLPDVFGYSGAMPQIYKKSGLDYFMTSKISWNDTNRFPWNTFWWEGIDGTRIFTHFIHGSYNACVTPDQMRNFWETYNSKLDSPEFLSAFGFGDGGGGPTRKQLEYIPRMKNIPGLPKARTGRTHDFFKRIEGECRDLPTWVGEFYFELHRGTYTSQAKTKRYNRKSELALRDAEQLSSVANGMGFDYPKQELVSDWETVLLNQFHDVIPGSSITEVYKDSEEQYRQVLSSAKTITENALEHITQNIDTAGDGAPIVAFNTLSWERSGAVAIPGRKSSTQVLDTEGHPIPSQQTADGLIFWAEGIPSCGYKVFRLTDGKKEERSPFTVKDGTITTPYYNIEIAKDGSIPRLYDRENSREVLPKGARANILQVFEDKPSNWDAWDIELQYQDKMWEFTASKAPVVIENGPVRLVVEAELKYGKSTINQKIILYARTRRIDFETKVDWQERRTLLKTAFPVDIRSAQATYEIAYGAIERPTHWNTSWDAARFEVSGHRWADLSEPGYGVSLLNDSKYGWDIKGNVMRLSLLRSPENPDPDADKGEHTFTYSLFPHSGGWTEGTLQAGHELNVPIRACADSIHGGSLPSRHSFISVDRPGVIVDAVKQAEDSGSTIVRLYEAYGSRGPVTLTFHK
ncbi:MAG TPA: alpha-mannosidase, partial [Armatimonadetes bacterium]|nr:alpha-mannosidase [Armatimonadota bacterium]